jgi:hypothetical protein
MGRSISIPYVELPYLQAKLTVAKRLRRRLPKPIPWIDGSINVLYQEIAECLVFGFNHAAITLCGGFMEHALRLALYERSTTVKVTVSHDTAEDFTKDPIWRKLETQQLASLISKAEEHKVVGLTAESKNWWNGFREDCRNVYAHYKIFSAVHGETETEFWTGTDGEAEEVKVSAQQRRNLWAVSKVRKDEREAMGLFREVTERFLEITEVMQWQGREPDGIPEWYLAERYKKFYLHDWDLPENQPKFAVVDDEDVVEWCWS